MRDRSVMRILCSLGLCCLPALATHADWNVHDTGALGDGVTDDTAAIQKALDEAGAAGGGVVHVPAGAYCIRGNLRIPGAVTLQGVFRTPPLNFKGPTGKLVGTVLEAYAGRGSQEGEPFIRLAGHAATLAGLIVRYPEWKQSDVPPLPYPPTVLGKGVEDVAVLDCLFLNAYEALHFQGSARMIIRNVFGYPSYRGLYIDACYDISRVENCHFWPFGVHYKPDDPYCKWVNVNGVAFEFGRTDWQYVTHTFCFGYGIGYRFSKTKNGSANGSFVGIGADSCRRAVYVEEAQKAGLLITNGEFVGRWSSKDSVGVEIAESVGQGKVNLNTCSFWGPLDMCLWSRSPRAQLSVANTNFCDWDISGTDAPAVRLDAGKAVLQGNTFDDGRTHVLVGEKMISAILMGNQAGGGFRAENLAGGRTQLIGNEQSPVQWTEDRKAHYRVDVGSAGDGLYLRGWHGREAAPEWGEGGTRRWSGPGSLFTLPTLPGKEYTLRVYLRISEHALAEENGLFIGEKRISNLPAAAGESTIKATFVAATDVAKIALRVKTWRPVDTISGSGDNRDLGVAVRHLDMVETQGGAFPRFNANTGEDGAVPAE
jgi:hypothetical protein